MKIGNLAGLQYVGESGITNYCKKAVINLIHSGEKVDAVKVLTMQGEHSDRHALLITLEFERIVVVKSGFASGYPGEGSRGYSYVLNLLNKYTDNIYEFAVSDEVFARVESSSLRISDLDEIAKLIPLDRNRLWDLIYFEESKKNQVYRDFPMTVPMSILDERLFDIACEFHVSPDNAILNAYRKLESIVRARVGLPHESSTKLFTKAFQGNESLLEWHGIDGGEQAGRANLFTGVFMTFRNRRAHKEPSHEQDDDIREFLLINQLFVLEKQSTPRLVDNNIEND